VSSGAAHPPGCDGPARRCGGRRTALAGGGELDRLSITLCPELPGGGARLFDDGPAGSSWSLIAASTTDAGALCLLYDRIRPA